MSASKHFTNQKGIPLTREEVFDEFVKRTLGQDSPIWMKLRDKFWLFLIPVGAGYGVYPADLIPDSPFVISFIDDFIVTQLPLVALAITDRIKKRWIRKKLAKAQQAETMRSQPQFQPVTQASSPPVLRPVQPGDLPARPPRSLRPNRYGYEGDGQDND